MKKEAKVMKFSESLYRRLKAISPAKREVIISSALDALVARAAIAPAEAVGEVSVAEAETETKMVLPEHHAELSPGSSGKPVEGSALVRRSLFVPIPLADCLDQLSAADQRHAVELLLAVFPDITHADRMRAVLEGNGELVMIAKDLRQLHKMFGPSLSPRLALRLRNAAHLWADKLLKGLGEEPPAMALPVPALGTMVAPDGVPGHWEPVVMWMPVRLHHRAPDLQVTLTESLRVSDAKWEQIVGVFFATRRKGGAA